MTGNDLTFVDLFAGCGGLALGFVREGFEPVGAVKSTPQPPPPTPRNIDDEHPRRRHRVQVRPAKGTGGDRRRHLVRVSVNSGPVTRTTPQPAVAGVRTGSGDSEARSSSWRTCRSSSIAAVRVLSVRKSTLSALTSWTVLNAADYGAPQTTATRNRDGSRIGVPQCHRRRTALRATEGEAMSTCARPSQIRRRLPNKPDGRNWHVGRAGIRDVLAPLSGRSPIGWQPFPDAGRARRRGLGDLVPGAGERRRPGPPTCSVGCGGTDPAPTIRTEFYKPEKGRYLHPVARRPIPCVRRLGFSRSPTTSCSPSMQRMTSVARQIGNAVPPVLAAALARAVRDHLAARDGVGEVRDGARAERWLVPTSA